MSNKLTFDHNNGNLYLRNDKGNEIDGGNFVLSAILTTLSWPIIAVVGALNIGISAVQRGALAWDEARLNEGLHYNDKVIEYAKSKRVSHQRKYNITQEKARNLALKMRIEGADRFDFDFEKIDCNQIKSTYRPLAQTYQIRLRQLREELDVLKAPELDLAKVRNIMKLAICKKNFRKLEKEDEMLTGLKWMVPLGFIYSIWQSANPNDQEKFPQELINEHNTLVQNTNFLVSYFRPSLGKAL